jgi:hypothetical protein
MFGLAMLGADCILCTYMLARNSNRLTLYEVQCDLSVFITVVVYFGYLAAYYVRMWRVYLCFDLYQNYL